MTQIIVEVAELRRQRQRRESRPRRRRPRRWMPGLAGGGRVGRDVEATAARREGQAREVIGRGRGNHRQAPYPYQRRHPPVAFVGGRCPTPAARVAL